MPSAFATHLEYVDCFALGAVVRALPLHCTVPLPRQPHLTEGMRLKAALVGQVVDGQAAACVGVHAIRPAQHTQHICIWSMQFPYILQGSLGILCRGHNAVAQVEPLALQKRMLVCALL